MGVELIHITPKTLIVKGIRKCWKSDDRSDSNYEEDCLGEKDERLIRQIISSGHTSTLEHSLITFDITDMSRACLQEMARHRIGVSPSVESTRYTLKGIVNNIQELSDCLKLTGNEKLDKLNLTHMINLRSLIIEENLPNDISKYGIVEAYKVTELVSFNFRGLRHFIELRRSPRALWEIQELTQDIINVIPKDYYIFIEDLL